MDINGEYPPGVFLRGLKFSAEKIRGLKFLGENLRGLKLFSEFDLNFFKKSPFSWLLQIQLSQISLSSLSEIRGVKFIWKK